MMTLPKKNSGVTLIEVIIYIALFSIIIGGGMVASYQIIQSTEAGTNHVIMEEEANFLLRKINWALTGASSYTITSGTNLSTVKDGTTFTFDLNSNNLRLNNTILNTSSISVSNLLISTPPLGNGVTTQFTLTTQQNGRNINQNFSTTKYLRQ